MNDRLKIQLNTITKIKCYFKLLFQKSMCITYSQLQKLNFLKKFMLAYLTKKHQNLGKPNPQKIIF